MNMHDLLDAADDFTHMPLNGYQIQSPGMWMEKLFTATDIPSTLQGYDECIME